MAAVFEDIKGLTLAIIAVWGTSESDLHAQITPPQITVPPVAQVAVLGSTATFTVQAVGREPLAYQWFFQGTNTIFGATDSVLNLANVKWSDAGPYSVVITNQLRAVTSAPAPLRVIAGSAMTNCAEGDLRALLAQGGTVTVGCDGVITLGSTLAITTNTTLDATGHQLTLSGSNTVRLLSVSTNVTFTAINLTIANGRDLEGAGVYNDGGNLNLLWVCCRDNLGTNWADNYYSTGEVRGAAIFNRAGAVNATNSSFTGNTVSSSGQRTTRGGAIFNDGGQLHLRNCLFQSNSVIVGTMVGEVTVGLEGTGGAIHNQGALSASDCAFLENRAVAGQGKGDYGGAGYAGGTARGGAICNPGSMTIERSLFARNTSTGGAGGRSTSPGFGFIPGYIGGSGGEAAGSALFIEGPSTLVNCTLTLNEAQGGSGGDGGPCGYDFDGGTGQMRYAAGGPGGYGGSGSGTIHDGVGALRITNCTIALNSSVGGSGGGGGFGNPPGGNGVPGTCTGAFQTTNGISANCLLGLNSPANCTGLIMDAGHNLSSDATCAFTGPGSLNSTDARLGALGNNGGPTATIALLPASPAIDGGDTATSPLADQRGFPRPVGLASDIGAYEYGSPALVQSTLQTDNHVDLLVLGTRGQPCRLFFSADLSNWTPLATNQFGPAGTATFRDETVGISQRFYRITLP